MKSLIPEILSSLIGLRCCEAELGNESTLVLQFEGKGQTYETGSYPWNFQTGSCSWRVMENDKILCGSGDGEDCINDFLHRIEGQKLVSVERISHNDIVLIFKDGLEIQLLSQSRNRECFSIKTPLKSCIAFSSAGGWFE